MASVTQDQLNGVNASQAIKVPCAAAATTNITLSGEQVIDGQTTSSSRVVLTAQTDGTENGIWISNSGAWTRAPDWDGADDVVQGTIVRVPNGTNNSGYWAVTTSGTITPGTTSVTITKTDANSTLRNDLASTATYSPGAGVGFELVYYPPLPTETAADVVSPEFHYSNPFRYITRSLHASIRDGTNTTDLASMFQNAMDNSRATGIGLKPEKGVYRIESSLTCNNGQYIWPESFSGGAGNDAAVKFDWRGTGALFVGPGNVINQVYFGFFEINMENNANASHKAIYFADGIRYSKIESLFISGITANTAHCIHLAAQTPSACFHVDIKEIIFWGTATCPGAGIYLEGDTVDTGRYNGVNIYGGFFYNVKVGIQIENCNNINVYSPYLAQNNVAAPSYGIRFQGNLNKHHNLYGLMFEGSTPSVHIQIDNSDNADSQNMGAFYASEITPGLIADSVVTDTYRYTLHAAEMRGMTLLRNIAADPFRIRTGSSSAPTPSTNADELVLDNSDTCGMTFEVPSTKQMQIRCSVNGKTNNEGAINYRDSQGDMLFTSSTAVGLVLDANQNLIIGGGTTAGANAVKSLVLNNGTAPTAGVTDGVSLYSEDVSASAELKVMDEAANVTTLSPHNFSLFEPPAQAPVPWSYYSKNEILGFEINVDMAGAIMALEKLTGQTFIHTKEIPKRSWDEDQEIKRQAHVILQEEQRLEKRHAMERRDKIRADLDMVDKRIGEIKKIKDLENNKRNLRLLEKEFKRKKILEDNIHECDKCIDKEDMPDFVPKEIPAWLKDRVK